MKKQLFIFFFLIWLMVIFYNSLLIPTSQAGAINVTGLVDKTLMVLKINLEPKLIRQILNVFAHIFEYYFLALFLYVILENFKLHYPWFLTLSISLFIGLVDEFIQGFVPGRVESIGDVFFDLAGAILGVLTIIIVKKHKNKSERFIQNLYKVCLDKSLEDHFFRNTAN
ncbi:MAG: VanZ family protein [Bacilli bacterium]|nr:VanZ family protein [Bacilli bacterium]